MEGVSDYVRFFKYEPGKIGPINAQRAHYNSSYRVTAAFLAYLTEKYDPEIVLKLNKLMREGNYKEEIFKELTESRSRNSTRNGGQRSSADRRSLPVEHRPLFVPRRRRLVSGPDAEEDGFLPRSADELQPDRQSLTRDPARDGQAGWPVRLKGSVWSR